ncbi:MAG: BON domain-containing protein [Candidatus Omnitrophota bacterium]
MKMNKSLIFFSSIAVFLFVGLFALVAQASEMDSRIEASAQKSYVYKTYLMNDAITTQSKEGIVTLTGTVAEESHKALAKETVANLPGVKSVDDQLVVKAEQPAENSDGWVGMKVKTALLFHSNVNAFKTEVGVKDGVITLKGEALSEAQKDLAGEYAKDVDGVKSVKNEMTVAKAEENKGLTLSEKIDDASITAQVKLALMYHRSTSALKTSVNTVDGVVTVGGTAKNDAEKALVDKLVKDVKGVTSVVNNMTIVVADASKK